MRKFLAVVRHEYKKIVLKWSFLIGTLMLPALALIFTFIPMLIFSLNSEPTRIAIVDRNGQVSERLKQNLSTEKFSERVRQQAGESIGNITASQDEQLRRSAEMMQSAYRFIDLDTTDKSGEELRRFLISRVSAGEIDAYLIVPENINDPNAVFEYRSRKGGDFVAGGMFQEALNSAVRSVRLAGENISEQKLDELSRRVNLDNKGLDETGAEKDTDGVMIASFIIGLMIYITLAIYGQAIMGAVVEEKETRIAEILFSSARPFELMLGKLVGVGLAGLTQLGIWVLTVAVLIGVAATSSDLAPFLSSVPQITPLMVVYFMLFFLVGFFTYAAIFALVGSMVTSLQEGGQFAFPPIMIMLAGFYFSFAVIRDPNSFLSFWVSIAPFLAPITMPVRILAETPPAWQILLSLFVNAAAIAGLVWLTARVYRVGMLMYGKRATIPEVFKWIRQA
ncbi:ABC transporter permease [Leptolyngbya sp. 7M]|uniref:ABC transporter permease n=1 Tax=Leptolyngbya sp. 7M TaxID=2812896 RepID=UPI001B8A9B14|nr:ABC transporter permease [Leptolyngbya sp. 7M]QYO65820.1 ABC transporter permease [Leptolyngbya sp. 7M]